MLLESVAYARPESVTDALQALGSSDSAAPLAGGQSLVNVLKHRVASLELLVDISRLEELRRIDVQSDGTLEIGACVTYDELDHHEAVRSAQPLLAHVAGHIEDQQIRCRGTIGGNCCLSDPTNNLPPLIVALDATMLIESPLGRREVPAREFFRGYFSTAVDEGELLRSIRIPPLGAGGGVGYQSPSPSAPIRRRSRGQRRSCAPTGRSRTHAWFWLASRPTPLRHTAMEERAARRGGEHRGGRGG